MKRAIVISLAGLDVAFIDRLVGLSLLDGLNRLAHRAVVQPPYPPDPVLASAMHATGTGPGAHGIFQAAMLDGCGAVPDGLARADESSLAERHICRLLGGAGVSCLWYRGLGLGCVCLRKLCICRRWL